MNPHPTFQNIVDNYPGCKLLSALIETAGGARIFVQPTCTEPVTTIDHVNYNTGERTTVVLTERRKGTKDRRSGESDAHPAGRRKSIDRRGS